MLAISILLCIVLSAVVDSNPIVQTAYGKVLGRNLKTFSQNKFYAFQGIPFAEPPVGDLRFRPPEPPKNWEGVLDSQNANKKCVQVSADFVPGEGEDCLYLNVYTPQLPKEDQNISLPVLVYIHGGAFITGSGSIDEAKPYKLMDYNIVMVTIQYRLGFFGFVSTGDLECPGNNGFKDQQFALRWVQENIDKFGGDPSKVTISGQSAGAASVGYQLLGPNAEGLFRGAIQASGSPLCSWTLQRDPKRYAYQIANYIEPTINEQNTSTNELMTFFRTVDVSSIKKFFYEMMLEDAVALAFNNAKGFIFSGVIEPEHDGAFLTETAFNKFKSRDFQAVPSLIGMNSEESRGYALGSKFEEVLRGYDAAPESIVTSSMHIIDMDLGREVGNAIRRFYVGDELLQENKGHSLRMMSDTGFGRPNIKQAHLVAEYTDVFFYEFAYSGDIGRNERPTEYYPGAESVGHTEDMAFIFPKIMEDVEKYSELDSLTIDRWTLLWTNFVKYLNPTPETSDVLQNVTWPKVSKNSFPYLVVNETIEVKYDLKKSMTDEYDRLFDEFAVPPLDTY